MDRQEMKADWIDFRELRSRLTFAEVLDFYSVTKVRERGGQLVGFCPLPGHSGEGNPSFSASAEKGIFQCFGCGAKGNLLDFAVLMDGGDPGRGSDVRRTALKLHKRFGRGDASPTAKEQPRERPEVFVNAPLQFRLTGLDPDHPYLRGRGFARETLERFGVGHCSKGAFAGRATFPLHGNDGELIGYAGRLADDSNVGPDCPKYLFPGRRDQDGALVEFRKSAFLYNGWRFTEPVRELVVVEGFASVWWLTQCGIPEAVALMGSSFSEEQLGLILKISDPRGRLWAFADGDPAGERWATELCAALARRRFSRILAQDGRQPTDYSPEELNDLFAQ